MHHREVGFAGWIEVAQDKVQGQYRKNMELHERLYDYQLLKKIIMS
jgi:hypothetical protein